MAQIKVTALKVSLERHREALSSAIHRAVMSALEYPPEKKFHRFFGLDPPDFVFPDDRSDDYTIIEISMFEGRSAEAKKNLIRLLFTNIERDCDIKPQDIEITITETPTHNWGIRGKCADELSLGYKIDI